MFGLNFVKFQQSEYVFHYTKGSLKKEGAGLSFYYYKPHSSLIVLPVGSKDVPFIFEETSIDFQTITIQGNLSYRIKNMEKLSQLLDYSYDPQKREYLSDDPLKLHQRIVNITHILLKERISKMDLRSVLMSGNDVATSVKTDITESSLINQYGLEILEFSILAIKPTKETARALEADSREDILKKADEAIYIRRNAAIEQERKVKENELNTEIAIKDKEREIKETELASEAIYQTKKNEIKRQQVEFEILNESKKKELIELEVINNKAIADSKAYEISVTLKAYENVDQNTIKAIASINMESNELIAMAFQDIANNASKIGEFNISPDLLRQLGKSSS